MNCTEFERWLDAELDTGSVGKLDIGSGGELDTGSVGELVIASGGEVDTGLGGALDAALVSREAAHAHAGGCARCRALERAGLRLEELLVGPPAPAPVGFTSRVVARLEVESPRPLQATPPRPAIAWWLRALGQPACATAGGLAALVTMLVWRADAVAAGLRIGLAALQASEPFRALGSLLAANPALSEPTRQLALAAAFLPVVGLTSLVLYRASQRWTQHLASIQTSIFRTD